MICNDLPAGGWGGGAEHQGKHSYCPKDRGDAMWNLKTFESPMNLEFKNLTNESFDQNGILYAIGTDFGKTAWSNPVTSGKVTMRWSEDCDNFYSTKGGHKEGDSR